MNLNEFHTNELALLKYITSKSRSVDQVCSQLSLGLVNGNGILVNQIMDKTKSKDLMDLSNKIIKVKDEFNNISYSDIMLKNMKSI